MNARNVTTGKRFMGLEGMTTDKNSLKSVATAQSQQEIDWTGMESMRQKCEVWSRVMGYHRPVSGYNIGKKQEFADRVNFKEPKHGD